MKRVYVETNFVLELALVQEQHESCGEILRFAEEGRFQLLIPAYSLIEPHETLGRRHRQRQKMKVDLDVELGQLTRNAAYAKRLGSFQDLSALLVDSADEETKRLDRVRERLLSVAEILPLDANTLATISHDQAQSDLSPQDGIVYASVIHHPRTAAPAESCFLSRDRDFDDPAIVSDLRAHSCTLIRRFDDALQHIRSRLEASD